MSARLNPFRQALDRAASAPARMNGDPLARAAALVRSLRPDWRDAPAFYQRRSEALDLLRRAGAAPCAGCEADGLRERARRLEALLRNAAAEVARHRRLLAEAAARARRRCRRAGLDPRQAALPFG